ncbi:hypothetical protein IFM89_020719 [Coptis chinensis]|uniref:SLC12A transporter C-terminal domain-containing protein n=1 Tax=Coptis chinensis TaxID=261450 RepID=A0A835H6Y8_9MAGN|nr:hypothetical protein IFM89_020719 [Coptis chinensis]
MGITMSVLRMLKLPAPGQHLHRLQSCEGVAEIVVAPNMSVGFRGIVQTTGLGNLKPNIVVMRYPEIWRRESLIEIPATFVGIINDCIVANKAVVIVKGLDEWPNEYQRQYGTIDLYWIVEGWWSHASSLSQLLLTKESFESCKIQAEVIVITMKSWETHVEASGEVPLHNFEAKFNDIAVLKDGSCSVRKPTPTTSQPSTLLLHGIHGYVGRECTKTVNGQGLQKRCCHPFHVTAS